MFYYGLGMLVIGYILLNFYGITPEEHKQGKSFTTSDTVASILIIGGLCVVVGHLLWWLGQLLLGWTQQLFYGVGAAYAETPMERCALLSFGAALFFTLALMLAFRAEGQYRQYRRTDHAKARRIQARHNYYAGVFHMVGKVMLFSSVVAFALKSL